jgi:hypothetical protein
MYPAVKSFAREHPTMILTLCYVVITAIGTGYSFFFYNEFDINIIKFADLSDFLLAAILEPLSLFIFALILIFILFIFWIDILFRKRFKAYRNFLEKRLKSKYTDPIGFLVIIVIFSIIKMQDLAVENANMIKNKAIDTYQVKFSENDSNEESTTLELLGSTSRFVYFYDPINKQSIVISPENISYMSKVITQKKQPINPQPITKEK